jgi:hypothetical protein
MGIEYSKRSLFVKWHVRVKMVGERDDMRSPLLFFGVPWWASDTRFHVTSDDLEVTS